MTNKESLASRLICIIEDRKMVYAIVEHDTITMSDIWHGSEKDNLFHKPTLVTAFLKELSQTHKFSEVTFGLIHPIFTLYPTSSYAKENEKSWLIGNHDNKNDFEYCTNHMDDGISNTFCIPKAFAIEIRDHFPTVNFIHINSASIQQFDNQNKTCVLSHSINGYQLVNVFRDGTLTSSNLYLCENEDSKLYYSLLPYQMFALDREIVPLYINQVVKKNSTLFKKLDTYLRHIHINEIPQEVDLSEDKSHNYLYSIYCISQCA